jgi:glycosyltransferase involved in cell wall biosynthesis
MRIGIDARELCGHPTGVGRYLAGLLDVWAGDERARRHEFVLYAHRALDLRLDMRRFSLREVHGGGGTWWEQRALPAVAGRDHLDVFFSPAYTTPLMLRCRRVVAIHDASFAAHPEWFAAREGLRRRLLSRRAAAAADAVITISQFSRGELVERLGVRDERIHVIPPGITAPCVTPPARSGASARVLYVGSIFNRRHVPELIRAFAAIAHRQPHVSLDVVGDNRTYPRDDISETIAREGANGQVRWRRFVDDVELRSLYAGARAFAFLSEYEGLGLTPLEALSVGVPPLLLDTAVARESCGDAALFVRSVAVPEITRALEQLLFDEGTRQRILAAAPATLARYNWRDAARRTLAVIEGAHA